VTITWKVLITQKWNDLATNQISVLISADVAMDSRLIANRLSVFPRRHRAGSTGWAVGES
jgi:hypothetical protein